MYRFLYFLVCFNLLNPFKGFSDVWLPPIFGEGMVLQSGQEIKVWGSASPRERVAVTLRGRSVVTRADRSGKWEVFLPSLSSGGPYILNILGKNLITIPNVWIGEVLIFSGDTLTLSEYSYSSVELSKVETPSYSAVLNLSQKVYNKVPTYGKRQLQWENSTNYPELVSIIKNLKGKIPPLGFIINNHPHSHLSSWINSDTLVNYYQFSDSLNFLEKAYIHNSISTSDVDKWIIDQYPSVLFDNMIKPIAGYTVSGVLFKNNYKEAPYAYYAKFLYKQVVNSMRDAWGNDSLEVLFMNPPTDNRKYVDELLYIQRKLMDLKKVGILSFTGNYRVQSFAKALQAFYENGIEIFRVPTLLNIAKKENKLILQFENYPTLKFNNKYGYGKGFYLAGKSRIFEPAQSYFKNDFTIEVSNQDIKNPVSVRYGFDNTLPEGNLITEFSGALPFKSDYWALTTDTSNYRTTWLPKREIKTFSSQMPSITHMAKGLNSSNTKFKPLRAISDKGEIINQLHKILHIKKRRRLKVPVHIASYEEEMDVITEELIVQTEKNVFLSAKIAYPKTKIKVPICIVDKPNPIFLDSLKKSGFAVLTFNPRVLSGLDSATHVNYLTYLDSTGNNFLGQKIYDFTRIIDFIETQKHIIDVSEVHLLQLDTTSQNRFDMLLAFALDDRIKSVFLQRHLLDLKISDIDTLKEGGFLFAPEFAKYASISEIIGLCTPRKLTIFAPVSANSKFLSRGLMLNYTRKGRYEYYKSNASRNLKIKTGSIYRETSSYFNALKKSFLEHIFE